MSIPFLNTSEVSRRSMMSIPSLKRLIFLVILWWVVSGSKEAKGQNFKELMLKIKGGRKSLPPR